MLYLISNWHEKSVLEEDKIYTLSNFFSEEAFDNQVVLLNYIPFLRYKLNESGSGLTSVISVFDICQNIKTTVGFPLGVEDLAIPKEIDKIYLSDRTLLVKDDKVIGRVSYNDYGFISSVRHLKDNGAFTEDIYDDRGFVSARYHGEEKEDEEEGVYEDVYTIEYFNELGDHTLTLIGGKVFVGRAHHPYLKKRQYGSLDEAINDVVKQLIGEAAAANPASRLSIITTTDPEVRQKTKELSHAGQIIRIMTDDSVADMGEEARLVTDTKVHGTLADDQSGISYMPIFLPKLNLGASDSVPLKTIYLKLPSFKAEEKIMRSILEKVIKDETLSLICEMDSHESISQATNLQTRLIEQHFEIETHSDTYEAVETYIMAKREDKLFKQQSDAVKEIQKSDAWANYVGAVDANSRISYLSQLNLYEVEEIFGKARLYIDFEAQYHMLRHTKAVSAGVPIISTHTSDFIIEGKNGVVLTTDEKEKEVNEAIDYFIYHLKNWNQALVCAIDIIEAYEPDRMMEKWQEVIR
ncbi:accessory Sec system protein Asp1 [Pseudolactococcus yaeyamensis]